ncbi:MAG: prepilin-type N-terminal cleavage/methylation domain-containing protein [Elusimicrobiaceae bacterium]|nr:prepilin-type N-terminal cleavage/methylation domain-containing protein [Elusimicrobiaceae bacterium]
MNKRAFTLIELLVVVLIIGILAAIALPQYEAAVLKTRFTTMIPLLRAIKDAQERYYLANNEYTVSLFNLDIGLPADCQPTSSSSTNMFKCGTDWYLDNAAGNGKASGDISASYCPDHNSGYSSCLENRLAGIKFYYDHHAQYAGQKRCMVGTNGGAKGQKLCKTFDGWKDN